MAIDSYANLKTEIANYIDRDDLTNEIDLFIDLAEERHRNEIRIREMIRRATVNAEKRYLALPDGYLQMRTLRLLTNPVTKLVFVNEDILETFRQETNGKPKYFTVHEEIEFDRVPDQSYTAEMIYYAEFTPLSSTNTSNGLLARSPGCYLYAALSAAEPFLVDDERIKTWETFYGAARDGLLISDRRSRYPGPLRSQPRGATP